MAGHSKFANIKHRKAAQDTKRGADDVQEVCANADFSDDVMAQLSQ